METQLINLIFSFLLDPARDFGRAINFELADPKANAFRQAIAQATSPEEVATLTGILQPETHPDYENFTLRRNQQGKVMDDAERKATQGVTDLAHAILAMTAKKK